MEGSVVVRKHGRRAAELHVLAEVIAASLAEVTTLAVDPSLDSYTLTDGDIGHSRADCSDNASSFVAEDKVLANLEVTIATVGKVVD